MDTPLPAECLIEARIELAALENGIGHFPPWLTREEALAEVRSNVKMLEEHLATCGNTWLNCTKTVT